MKTLKKRIPVEFMLQINEEVRETKDEKSA